MRRLSIIDLPGGHQPAWNEAKDVAVIFNGEIYNYRELRERLTSLGHTFSTQSRYGGFGSCVGRVGRGLFAGAARDVCVRVARFAETVCDVAAAFSRARSAGDQAALLHADGGWIFVRVGGARVAGARRCGCCWKQISPDALTSYLLFGSVSEPVTLIEGVFSLPPGHRMLLYVPERRRTPRARPWWDLMRSPAARDPRKPRIFETAVERVRPLLEDAVRAHLIADVPVGLFLSSGMDSGAIAAIAGKIKPNIWSFTLSFPGTSYDEAALAREVAKACGTQHREVALDGEGDARAPR